MTISTERQSSGFTQVLLEINEVSFKWYVIILVVMTLIDLWTQGAVRRVGVSFGALTVFVAVSGVLKLLYQWKVLNNWITTVIKAHQEGKLLERILAKLLMGAEKALDWTQQKVLQGRALSDRIPALSKGIFTWLLVMYLGLLLIEEFKKDWTVRVLHLDINTLLVGVIMVGVFMILFQSREDVMESPVMTRRLQPVDYFLVTILAVGSAGLVYLKINNFGLPGIALAILSGASIFMLAILSSHDNDTV